jgi:GH43 family beta-xylosidase
MTDTPRTPAQTETYLNPVYGRDCPDPFVLKFAGEYWAFCTGFWRDGRAFGVLHSLDLVEWRELAGALEPLPGGHTCYWAPEVVYDNGRFLMYYSVGNEVNMTIRVAVSSHPAGPYVDAGRSLTREQFAIDAHVFVDDDGTRHLFYATDFLEHTHIGTGTVRDRLIDALTLEGRPVPVTRARYDWQVYDPERREKGGVRWHTVEGPTVLKHKGRYYEMFSGGNWQNTTYGVSFATAARVDEPSEWEQACDGAHVLPILRTLPGKVLGPGHNSVVRGPDNRQLFCIYHRWAEEGRVLAIDRLDWAGERMLVLGPSTTPQPAPIAPTFSDLFDAERPAGLGENWECVGGRWAVRGGEAVQDEAGGKAEAEARCSVAASSFLAEVTLRGVSGEHQGGAYGARLRSHDADHLTLEILLEPETRRVSVAAEAGEASPPAVSAVLPPDFDFSAPHLLRLEVDETFVSVRLDEAAFSWRGRLERLASAARLALATRGMAAAFKGFALTVGWEDLFMEEGLEGRGWKTSEANGKWYLKDRQLWYAPKGNERGAYWRGPLVESYEMVVNARLERGAVEGSGYGFYPAHGGDRARGPLLALEGTEGIWALRLLEDDAGNSQAASAGRVFRLPASFDPFEHQHFRFTKQGGRLRLQWESEPLGTIEAPREATCIGLSAWGAGAAFDSVRVTEMSSV